MAGDDTIPPPDQRRTHGEHAVVSISAGHVQLQQVSGVKPDLVTN